MDLVGFSSWFLVSHWVGGASWEAYKEKKSKRSKKLFAFCFIKNLIL
jgi:hypothetical protein